MMTSPPTISNPDANNDSAESRSRKRRKIEYQSQADPIISKCNRNQWSTSTEQQIYSSKLLEALGQVRRNNLQNSSPAVARRTVRETADRVLAVTAKGRTRWSRAILTGRLSFRISRKHKKLKLSSGSTIKSKKPVEKMKKLPALQRKVRALSHLVPGCRKLPVPNLLEETSDYIAALEMQVRAMTFLTGILTGGCTGSLAPNMP